MATTTNYSFTKPTVGGDQDTWGTQLNANWDALDTLLGGTNATEFAILDGATVTTAELNHVSGVTSAIQTQLNAKAPTASPTFTGTPTAPTATAGTDTTQIATTEFVTDAVATAVGGVSAIPSGAVMPFAMSTAPSGWLKCNGAEVSRTTYAALFAAIGTTFGVGDGSTTFALPDMRGEFARGWDDGRGVDSGRVFGTSQADAFKAHKHGSGTLSNYSNTNGTYGSGASLGLHTGISSGSQIATTSEGGTETRPRNVALLYCIKV
jgi:microcystin-dependent protein